MSQTSISQCANDTDFQVRVMSCVYSEAFTNEDVEDTTFAQMVRRGGANMVPIYWAVAVAVEAQYASGLAAGRGSPGHDADVVTDAMILDAVQEKWPTETTPTPP